MRPTSLVLVLALAALLCAADAVAQETTEKLGQVHFPVSCSPAAQQQFDRAVALLHSFWFRESNKAFAEVAATDPRCAMAHWGIALGQRGNPISNVPTAEALKKGWAAVEQAKAAGAKSSRERDYIAAAEAFYKDPDKPDPAARFLAYEKAMERVYRRHRDDREAAAFYALALLPNETVLSADKTYDKQLKAGAILEKLFAEQPEHPGAAHYLIHAYDYPALAPRALPAARRYAQIAPSSDHALHMPSHIFVRLGLWPESIQSNQAAAAAAKAYALNVDPGAPPPTPLHMLHWLIEARLQLGQDAEARAILDELAAVQKLPDTLGAAVVAAGVPARYAVERRQWAEAAALTVRASRFPYAEGITHFARALGRARTGDVAGARADVEKLAALRDAAAQAKQPYWARQIESQHRAAAAWLARAEAKNSDALAHMRAAADLEDSTQEHQSARDAIVPARELLGDLLIELGQPGLALKEFETALAKAPNRFNGLFGAARAAQLAGDRARAKTYYARLVAMCGEGRSERDELQQAKAFVAEETR